MLIGDLNLKEEAFEKAEEYLQKTLAITQQALGSASPDYATILVKMGDLGIARGEWAVLSACESGLGEIRSGEGVLGLRRAFSVAGAQTLIMSLWKLDDGPTRDWMSHLYEHRYSEGMETAQAVHQANLELLELRRQQGLTTQPFY